LGSSTLVALGKLSWEKGDENHEPRESFRNARNSGQEHRALNFWQVYQLWKVGGMDNYHRKVSKVFRCKRKKIEGPKSLYISWSITQSPGIVNGSKCQNPHSPLLEFFITHEPTPSIITSPIRKL
jgi:hypothetical protein